MLKIFCLLSLLLSPLAQAIPLESPAPLAAQALTPAPDAGVPHADPMSTIQRIPIVPSPEPGQPLGQKWYDRISLRGYTQFRFNRIGNPDWNLVSPQGDKSIGGGNSFFIRRARLVFSGDITDQVYIYIQPDMASTPDGGTATHFLQLRDLYADIYLEANREFRIRLGQSKVPFGFENMQSSQNRLALDRNDALNSPVKDERDIGLFFYWAPQEIRKRFKYLVDSGLKGSGDYGLIGLGAYNGQNANRPDLNRKLHYVARATYPFLLPNGQYIETSLQAFTGRFVVGTAAGGTPAVTPTAAADYKDQRWAASLIVYPQPIGFQAEFNQGTGPRLNDARNAVIDGEVEGGYAQVMYKYHNIIPFVKAQYYNGGRKSDSNAPMQKIRELELGTEWEVIKMVELTGSFSWSDRTTGKDPYGNLKGNLIRLQAQINY